MIVGAKKAGPVIVTFRMFIEAPALVTMPPFHCTPPASVALIVKPPPSSVTPSGTVIGSVTAQSSVRV